MWCGECGYCPKAGFEGSPRVDSDHGELDLKRLVPAWAWWTLSIEVLLIASGVVFSWAIGVHYARTVVSTSLLAVGSLVVVVAHFRAYFRTLSNTQSQGTFAIVSKPMTIWGLVLRGLPETSLLVSSFLWGVTGVLLSVFVIGGLDYMSIERLFVPEKQAETQGAAESSLKNAGAIQNGDKSETPSNIEEAVTQFADTAPMPEQSDEDEKDENSPMSDEDDPLGDAETLEESLPPGQVVTCAIVGYTVSNDGEPRSLLLAAPASGGWRYVARMPIDDIPSDVVAELIARFPDHLSPRPLVECPFGGQWLTPEFYCDIHIPESAAGSRVMEPTFVQLQSEP